MLLSLPAQRVYDTTVGSAHRNDKRIYENEEVDTIPRIVRIVSGNIDTKFDSAFAGINRLPLLTKSVILRFFQRAVFAPRISPEANSNCDHVTQSDV
jgi:hypothetical protein